MDQNERFSLVLRARLERCEMTQKQLGQLVGLSQHTISDYVCGKTAPIIGDAASIAKVLSLSLDSIFSLHGREGVYYPSAAGMETSAAVSSGSRRKKESCAGNDPVCRQNCR